MKKIIVTLFFFLFFTNFSSSEIYPLESKTIDQYAIRYQVYKICVDNKVLVFTQDFKTNTTTNLLQLFEEVNGKSLPAKC